MTHVVLVGMTMTGKTATARRLAAALGRPSTDTDSSVEQRGGRAVRDIFAIDGEATFRRLELEALHDALADPTPQVIASGGGIVTTPAGRQALSATDHVVVWLRATLPTLLARHASSRAGHRPLLDDDPAGMLETMLRTRSPWYEQVADVTVDVDGRSLDEVAEAIHARLVERSTEPIDRRDAR